MQGESRVRNSAITDLSGGCPGKGYPYRALMTSETDDAFARFIRVSCHFLMG